jgi:two-component system, LytTR family, response regulator
VAQIQFIEAADDYVKVHTADGYFLKNKTMAYFESALDKNIFIRIHRSFIVNVQLITRLDPYDKETYLAVLSTGKKLSVSKTGYSKLKEVLGI